MKRIIHPLLFLTLLLGACSPGIPSPQPASAPSPTPIRLPTSESTLPTPLVHSDTVPSQPHIDQPPDGNAPTLPVDKGPCAYMWASQPLTNLTLDLQAAITSLHPEAQGFAFAFGEDCIYQDGSKSFLAKETDFNITLPVVDLADEDRLGEWIKKVMEVVVGLPAEKVEGPQPGRVTLIFTAGTQQKFIQFYINVYQSLDPNLSGAEIYRALQTGQ